MAVRVRPVAASAAPRPTWVMLEYSTTPPELSSNMPGGGGYGAWW